ncbi:MAG: relaxase/mobilization nuclease domain-containing protein [Hyphomicrobiaceae bacterium]|nr:relaxase/mobilization nuclease domain-containing protein [Hyphomicrobiaceae bacterium]
MAIRDDDVWRLPSTVKGQHVKLKSGGGAKRPLSQSAKARLRQIVNKAPEAMVKLTGRSRGGAGHLKAHLDYLTRNGRLQAETQDGERITDRGRLRDLHDDWVLANSAETRGRPTGNGAQSVAIMLSMPPRTPPDRVEAAARTWARETLSGRYDWLMVRHDDTDHPHVHVTVRAVGYDGRRLAPGPNDLQMWRMSFARELRRLGIEAEATPRQARGIVRKRASGSMLGIEQRGIEPRVRRLERQQAELEARAPKLPQPRDWSRDIQARQESIRRAYLAQADALAAGDAADRQLARDIRRFVSDMPVPLTRRQALAVELRHVLEQRHGREAPSHTTAVPLRQPNHGPELRPTRLSPDIPRRGPKGR